MQTLILLSLLSFATLYATGYVENREMAQVAMWQAAKVYQEQHEPQ